MNDEIELGCAYCHQPLPEEDKIIHTHYGKTCSRLCSHTLIDIRSLEEDLEKLQIKVNNMAQYLTNKVRKETGCNNIKIDFDN